jgi:2-polyprenyl-3-methyl-5-hydroxy-6-metoxy-1,4-benzoquinol methylase
MPYTPGHSPNATAFMARRSLRTHGAFIHPLLRPDLSVLDLGCGPGTLTIDLAREVLQGHVHGVDQAESQIAAARRAAEESQLTNLTFEAGDAGRVLLQPAHFDLIFSHALFEHLPDPVGTLRAVRPSLKSGGSIALRSPDWGGFVLFPETEACAGAIAAYERMQRRNGGDTHAGRKLACWLKEAGFIEVRATATYEIYPTAGLIADYLAEQLDAAGELAHAEALRVWARDPDALFAQAWFEAVGRQQ